MSKLKKLILIGSILLVIIMQPLSAVAVEIPEAPKPPEAPTQEQLVAPTPPPPPTSPQPPSQPNPANNTTNNQPAENNPVPENTPTQNPVSPATDNPPIADGNVGDTVVKTGNATNSTLVTTQANTSIAGNNASPSSTSTGNTGNGTESTNQSSASNALNQTTSQDNQATVNNDGNLSTITGVNSASNNVGNSTIDTGDANTSGTLITAANTNIDGVMVSEFNIADNHTGDIILDFNQNCITGCGGSIPASVENVSNGSDSTNIADTTLTSVNNTLQNNEATVAGTLTLSADSGQNTASRNTGGDSTITTGDTNVSGSVLNLLNNNVAGKVVVGVVNVFGDLIGDIVLPIEALAGINSSSGNNNNGVDSQNLVNTNQNITQETFQNNDANIENNLLLDANTGANLALSNTGGNTSVTTGTASTDSRIINIANSNLSGGNIWLVIVNEAGKWIGKIIGSPEGTAVAGSSNMEITVGENGEVSATNIGNGAGSTNTSTNTQNTNTTTAQNNDANIVNNLNLTANTGKNNTSNNTGGNNNITTGDANIIANIINFVNNNIASDSKVVVTLVNVFGSWLGDFVGPGFKKEPKGSPQSANNPSTSQNQNTNTSQSTSNETHTVLVPLVSTAAAPILKPISNTVTKITRQVSSTVVQVADFKETKTPETPKQPVSTLGINKTGAPETLQINLAWLLFILPFLFLITAIKLLPKLFRP